jgi:hypothetical protein
VIISAKLNGNTGLVTATSFQSSSFPAFTVINASTVVQLNKDDVVQLYYFANKEFVIEEADSGSILGNRFSVKRLF